MDRVGPSQVKSVWVSCWAFKPNMSQRTCTANMSVLTTHSHNLETDYITLKAESHTLLCYIAICDLMHALSG